MSRFYVNKESVKGNSIHISGREAHHILDVMRLKLLDEVIAFDGSGKEYIGIVKKANRKSLEVEITRIRDAARKDNHIVTLIQAIPKKEKMDYICEKATELGVSSIIPVTTKRTVPDWSEAKKTSIVERWRRITHEAAKQCGRLDIPDLAPIMPVEEAIKAVDGYDLRLIAALNDKAIGLKNALRSAKGAKKAIAIGPEGDFTAEEIAAAVKSNFLIVNLGPLILKSDTAGLAVLSIINYEYSNLI
jgi:16S rRNA (uracil1498-N3)-methyltransferase